MDGKLVAFFVANIFICILGIIEAFFFDFFGVILGICAIVCAIFGSVGFMCMQEHVLLIYMGSSGVLSIAAAGICVYHIFSSYWAPVTFEILLIPCFICGIVCGFLYYREIKQDKY